jgi:hypothetical protein
VRVPVNVVIDAADSLELAEFVSGLHNLDDGRLVCHPPPGGTGDRWLAYDLLVALGKDLTGFGAEHVGMRAWRWAELWLRAEEIGDVFVLRAHLLNERALERLLALQRACGFQLWLIGVRAPQYSQRDLLKGPAASEVDVRAFLIRWRPVAAACTQTGSEHVDSFPAVPAMSFLTFRAACRRLLAPPEFDQVDAVFCNTLRAALDWLHERQRTLQTVRQIDLELADPQSYVVNDRYRAKLEIQARQIQESLWHQFLRELAALLESNLNVFSDAEATVRLRAIQVSCFRYGLLLQMATGQRGPSACSDAQSRLKAACVGRLRTLLTPHLAAAATLALLTGGGAEVLAPLRLNQLECGPGQGNANTFAVPRDAQRLIRAHVLERRAQGASDDAPVFAAAGGRTTGQRVLKRRLEQVARRLAVHIPGACVPEASVSDWLQQPGAVVRLPIVRLAVAEP